MSYRGFWLSATFFVKIMTSKTDIFTVLAIFTQTKVNNFQIS